MPTYKIQPLGRSRTCAITAMNAAAVLNVVRQLDCKQADVLREGIYAFTVRLDSNGLWSVYQRNQLGHTDATEEFG